MYARRPNLLIGLPVTGVRLMFRLFVTLAALSVTIFLGVGAGAVGAISQAQGRGTLACHGSLLGQHLNRPIVGIASTPDQEGYWLVASDGGIFSFGDAGYFGSMGGQPLDQPVVGMASTADGRGYWLVASDGGIFSFGDAQFYGSAGSVHLNQPIIGMAGTSNSSGYWLAAADGGIFAFGNATFFGSGPQTDSGTLNLVAFSAATTSGGYILGSANRAVELFAFGDARYAGVAYAPNDASHLVGLTSPVASDDYAYWDATAAGGVDVDDPGPSTGLGSHASC